MSRLKSQLGRFSHKTKGRVEFAEATEGTDRQSGSYEGLESTERDARKDLGEEMENDTMRLDRDKDYINLIEEYRDDVNYQNTIASNSEGNSYNHYGTRGEKRMLVDSIIFSKVAIKNRNL